MSRVAIGRSQTKKHTNRGVGVPDLPRQSLAFALAAEQNGN